jgi:D-beta-D-heptose 7-phosphate kinase/D-beta-D-heptose 1-phosphate adenosyltransferase
MVSAGSKRGRHPQKVVLPVSELASLIYHDIFDFPMTKKELKKWKFGPEIKIKKQIKARKIGNYYILEGREKIITDRERRGKASLKKMDLARNAAKALASLPSLKMVAITGALAMANADSDSDVDLLLVTSAGTLWTTRLLAYLKLDLLGIPRRKYGEKKEKNRLCLNMWLDESDLVWDEEDRNLYTAHELAQIVPLLNKDKVYERLIGKNVWIKNFWPNAVTLPGGIGKQRGKGGPLRILEPLARNFQYWYMRDKITREIVTPTRAIFHPRDWGKTVALRLRGRLY